MKEWVVVACRAEAKIFERHNKDEELQWVKTLTNKKGRRRERDFESDKPGMSYAKFSASHSPHSLEGKHQHAEVVALHFSHQIAEFIKKSFLEKRLDRLTLFAGAHFLGHLKKNLEPLGKTLPMNFVSKNIEKQNIYQIEKFL